MVIVDGESSWTNVVVVDILSSSRARREWYGSEVKFKANFDAVNETGTAPCH